MALGFLLPPNYANLGALDSLLGAVDVRDTLATVPLCGLGVIDALELQQRGPGVGVALASLVAVYLLAMQSLSSRCALTRCACP
jgi:hypothetical protein